MLDIFTSDGNTISATPENVSLNFQLRLRESALGEPGQVFADKIKAQEAAINGPNAQFVKRATQVMKTLNYVCKGMEAYGMVRGIGTIIHTKGNIVCTGSGGLAEPIGDALSWTGEGIAKSAEVPLGKLWDGEWFPGAKIIQDSGIGKLVVPQNNVLIAQGGPIKSMCQQINCRTYSSVQGKPITGGVDKIPGLQGSQLGQQISGRLSSNLNVADPSTLTGALSMGCFGGVVHSMAKKNAIDCQYLACLKEQSALGLSVQTCELSHAYAQCMNVAGELSELPIARIYKNMIANLNSVIQNLPAVALKIQLDIACAPHLKFRENIGCFDTPRTLCRIKDSFLQIQDIRKSAMQAYSGVTPEETERYLNVCNQAAQPFNGQIQQVNSQVRQLGSQVLGAAGYFDTFSKIGALRRDLEWRAASLPPDGVQLLAREYEKYSKTVQGGAAPIEKYIKTKTEGGTSVIEKTQEYERLPDSVRLKLDNFIELANQDQKVLSELNALAQQGLTDGKFSVYTRLKSQGIESVMFETQDIGGQKVLVEKVYGREGVPIYDEDGNPPSDYKPGVSYTEALSTATKKEQQLFQILNNKGSDASMMFKKARALKPGSSEVLPDGTRIANLGDGTIEIYTKDQQRVQFTKTEQDVLVETGYAQAQTRNAEAVGQLTDYLAQWAFSKGYLDFLTLEGMFGIKFRALDPEAWKENLCNMQNQLIDNDEGVIFDVQPNFAKPIATFGAEVLPIKNETNLSYVYTTAVYITNPERNRTFGFTNQNFNYTMLIVFTELQDCQGSCPEEFRLTPQIVNLTEGSTFGNSNGPRTRVDVLPGRYGKMCIRFGQFNAQRQVVPARYPVPNQIGGSLSREQYCRTISEEVFHTGSPVVEAQATVTGGWV
jgi:hypothetical protein